MALPSLLLAALVAWPLISFLSAHLRRKALTAWYALNQQALVGEGDYVLVHSAAGVSIPRSTTSSIETR